MVVSIFHPLVWHFHDLEEDRIPYTVIGEELPTEGLLDSKACSICREHGPASHDEFFNDEPSNDGTGATHSSCDVLFQSKTLNCPPPLCLYQELH
ncbi:hypothetical protein BHE74_00017061 [Ensete ventricosum]|nr:hypothetical protein BHE74_00017061 [Ensete ventricosum]